MCGYLLQTGEVMHMPYLIASLFQSWTTTKYCIFVSDKCIGFKNQIWKYYFMDSLSEWKLYAIVTVASGKFVLTPTDCF